MVLVPGYYTCAQLCGLVMQGVIEALAASGLPSGTWRVVGFSIDPEDTPASARSREADDRGYARFVMQRDRERWSDDSAALALRLLTGTATASRQLSAAIGYRYDETARERASPTIAHSAGFVVATPDGRIARYFPGVRFEPAELRRAVEDARDGRIGSWNERLTLLCGHFDPVTGRYSFAVMNLVRAVGALVALSLATWIWRRRRSR